MSRGHELLHETLRLSGGWLVALIAASIAVLLLALFITGGKRTRFSPASISWILMAALLAPLPLAALSMVDFMGRLRSLFEASGALSGGGVSITVMPPVPVSQPSGSSEWACALFLVWAVGALARGGGIARDWRWWRVMRSKSVEPDSDLQTAFQQIAAKMGVRASLALSAHCPEPVVIGIARSVVVLPAALPDRLDDDELRAVFAHELAHVRRTDNLAGLGVALIRSLFWFDPIHSIALRRLFELRERACDEEVLALDCRPDRLISAIAKSCDEIPLSSTVACMSGLRVRERMESIMSYAAKDSSLFSHARVRLATMLGAFVFIVAVGVQIPSPAIAALSDDRPTLSGTSAVTAEGVLMVGLELRSAEGTLISAPRISMTAGQPVNVTTTAKGITWTIIGNVSADGTGSVTAEAVEKGADGTERRLHLVSGEIRPSAGEAGPTRVLPHQITLHFTDADLHEVARAFSDATGIPVIVDEGITGRVNLDSREKQWPTALADALAPLGLRADFSGNEIRIVKGPQPRPVPAAPSGAVFHQIAGQVGAKPAVPKPLPPGYERVGGGITAPRYLHRVDPVYTSSGKQARVSGLVILQILIDEQGKVAGAEVLKGLPFGLSEAALEAVKQWTFEPATKDGVPVPVAMTITISFRLPSLEEAQP
ncbi:MAG TPA: M56 family metallopeptidase [Thermoanaerobaculia bacterium]|nr:M56 family metallopeptidase [Thermoanaerobaculia bacterium]